MRLFLPSEPLIVNLINYLIISRFKIFKVGAVDVFCIYLTSAPDRDQTSVGG